jgi:hypothetical protein
MPSPDSFFYNIVNGIYNYFGTSATIWQIKYVVCSRIIQVSKACGYSEPTEPPIPLEESRPLRKIEPLIPI